MPPPYDRHVFICTNDRPGDDARGSCTARGAEAVREAFKQKLKERGLKSQVRANASGCLDNCAAGVAVVVYPEAVWYQKVTAADVDEIIESHLIGGRPVERLRWPAPACPR
jgi:(2Fe-2S) ferredoxin